MAFLPFVALAATAGGDVIKGIGNYKADMYKSQVAANNAIIERQNANYSASAGAAQTEQEGLKARAKLANVKAGIAASNLDVGTGSAVDVQQTQREIGTLDQQTVANRAANQVYGYESQATNFQAQSTLYKSQAPFDLASGLLSAAGDVARGIPSLPGGSSLLSGSPSVPDNYAWMAGNSAGPDTASEFSDLG